MSYLDSSTATINATLTKAGELQAIEGILKYAFFSIGDTEIDYRLSDSSISAIKIMEASTVINQSKKKLYIDLPEGSTAPYQISLDTYALTMANGASNPVSISTIVGNDSSYNVFNPRADLITLYGDNSAVNKLFQSINVSLGNTVSASTVNLTSKNTAAGFIVSINNGLPISETVVLYVTGNDSGATQELIITISN